MSQTAPGVFAPPRALQGSTIPVQVRWDPSQGKGPVTLRFSRPFELLEAHNVEAVEHEEGTPTVIVTAEEPGYIGVLIQADRAGDAATDLTIEIRASLGQQEFVDQRTVRLFRPDVTVRTVRPTATIEGEPGKLAVKAPIDLSNVGEGTAILVLHVDHVDRDESALTQPAETARAAFVQDIATRLPGLAEALPKHGDLLRALGNVLQNPPDIDDAEVLDSLDAFLERFNTAMMTDSDLDESLQQVFAWAVARNFTLAELLVEFVNYLVAIGDESIILGNALDRLPLPQGTSRYRVSLDLLDFNKGDYPRIEIGEVEFFTAVACEIPAHQLLRYVPVTQRKGGIPID